MIEFSCLAGSYGSGLALVCLPVFKTGVGHVCVPGEFDSHTLPPEETSGASAPPDTEPDSDPGSFFMIDNAYVY